MKTQNMRLTATVLLTCGAAGLVGVGGMGGCSEGGSRTAAREVGARPVVSQTAVEAAMQGDSSSLGFFDDLETKPLASQDDAIYACLLLGTGASAPSYEQRVAMARQLGYVPEGYNRPARQAVTMGEVAGMVTKILEGRRPATEDEAMAKLVHREIAPASARANQGLTGAQLVSMAGGVRDAMALEGVQKVPAPVVPEVVRPAAPMVASAETAVPVSPAPTAPAGAQARNPTVRVAEVLRPGTPSGEPMPPDAAGISTQGVALSEVGRTNQVKAAPASARTGAAGATARPAAPASNGVPNAMPAGLPASNVPPALGGKGRAEPLPEIPLGSSPPAIELQDPSGRPAVIGPDATVITPGQPKRADAPKVDTTKPAQKPEAKPSEIKKDPKVDEPKKPGESDWVTGQPLKKKPTSPDEPK